MVITLLNNNFIILFYINIIVETTSSFISPNKSKLSIFSESNDEIKEYDRIIKGDIKENIFDEQDERFEQDVFNGSTLINEITNLYESTSEYLNSFNIYFYFKINEKTENIFEIKTDELNIDIQCVSDLISNIIQKINSQKISINLENNEFILSLKDYENIDFYNDNYELRPFDKKSRRPKYDCPSFSPSSVLDELITQELCFFVKKPTNIVLLKKSEKGNRKTMIINAKVNVK